jgi:hypothetical protein
MVVGCSNPQQPRTPNANPNLNPNPNPNLIGVSLELEKKMGGDEDGGEKKLI